MFPIKYIFALVTLSVVGAIAETHSVVFVNKCGRGTPMLIQGSQMLSTGAEFTSNGPLTNAIAYLQGGNCGFAGEGCTVVQTTLKNPTSPGDGSLTAISLILPNSFSVATGFGYFNGCDGAGADCTNAECRLPFLNPNITTLQVPCQSNNVNLAITFCD
ncbi:hypothetical protein D9619_012484 [Psilocybe cf. subviscida]|uniref:Glycopeptide n=1 Tax=Psilocybe cf. subviscida TaxID=2480587 RepID=A0A8H5ARQ0_9AGAR|nr:hypothetical protein D9619_012484 [Psilocybe cf. subviscida]